VKSILFISLGGAMGAAARYGATRLFSLSVNLGFPLSTIIINTLGCFILGVFEGMIKPQGGFTALNLLLVTGFLSSFTTFSLYTKEIFSFFSTGRTGFALAYITANHVLALLSLLLGYLSGKGAVSFFGFIRL